MGEGHQPCAIDPLRRARLNGEVTQRTFLPEPGLSRKAQGNPGRQIRGPCLHGPIRARQRRLWPAAFLALWCSQAAAAAAAAEIREIVVTNDFSLEPGDHSARVVVRANHITVEGNGATLVGPGTVGDAKSLETAGTGVLMEGTIGVTLKNLRVKGFATGLILRDVQAAAITACDFSDNYHNPGHGWGELPARGGILCERVRHSIFQNNRASRVWDGLHLVDSDDNLVVSNDFSHCSNTAAKLWHSCRNQFLHNDLSYGIRIDRGAGEVHARDSTCVLIETGSDDNYWYQNDITHGGDGIFIRPLNRWVSRGNIFVENDTSHANNNCVESWSPGNIFIRNKANHGSYGFWLGGSDQTVLIGNEAAFNGLPSGPHNAPEPGFRHGGIVIVGGSSSHTLIQGNYLHHNNGAGIAFRGDTRTAGGQWKTEHWIIQQNRIVSNQFGIWGRWGEGILLAANDIRGNTNGNYLTNVTHLIQLPERSDAHTAPLLELIGPAVVRTGEAARFEAVTRAGPEPAGSLNFRWWLEGEAGREPFFQRVFERPGFHRLGLTVDNGALASLAWRDLLVVEPVRHELGTEGGAAEWGFELEGDSPQTGRILFADDAEALAGQRSLRFTPRPYPGAYATAVYPRGRNARWDFSGRQSIKFWLKARNPNIPGFQNAGPVIRLLGPDGHLELKPARDGNVLNDPPFSEARWLWMPINIPLAGDARWLRLEEGQVHLSRIDAIAVSVDSWGWEPFTIWLDGLTVE